MTSSRERAAGSRAAFGFAGGGGIYCLFVVADDVRVTVALLDLVYRSASVWGQFGDNIDRCERNVNQMSSSQETTQCYDIQVIAMRVMDARSVPEWRESWTVDPVVAGSSPVALAEQK